jgi:hypothetical protein
MCISKCVYLDKLKGIVTRATRSKAQKVIFRRKKLEILHDSYGTRHSKKFHRNSSSFELLKGYI